MVNPLLNTRWANSRRIVKRLVITGTLVLETPTQLSNGDADGAADISLLRDPLEGRALLTGTSLAGALRSYLRRREKGYGVEATRDALTAKLFGAHTQRTEDNPDDPGDSDQSYLITHDALGNMPETELRDGVVIDPQTRTAEEKKKYDLELLVAGTIFPLRFELLIPEGEKTPNEADLKRACAVALSGLENGEIRLGTRKRRGFGLCCLAAPGWSVTEYNLTEPDGLLGWLAGSVTAGEPNESIAKLFVQESAVAALDQRNRFRLKATFGLAGSLLIRAGSDDPKAPDMVHLKSKRNGKHSPVPVLSGTSLAGALRARGLRIANTVSNDSSKVTSFIDSLFGKRMEDSTTQPVAGRLWVEETEVCDPLELVVNRVKIDRFTGGSYPGALFNQQPIFGVDETRVDVELMVEEPQKADIGLLLLLLKDLWTKDLPLGGEASVGRGRLTGKTATLVHQQNGKNPECWSILQDGDRLSIDGKEDQLQTFVNAFVTAVGRKLIEEGENVRQ